MNLFHHVSRFYSPKTRRMARSSSNVMPGGRTIFFFLRFSNAFLAPYLAALLMAAEAIAFPAMSIRGMMPPRWWVRRGGRRRLRVRPIALLHRPHMVLEQ